jgi:hypothetical protein
MEGGEEVGHAESGRWVCVEKDRMGYLFWYMQQANYAVARWFQMDRRDLIPERSLPPHSALPSMVANRFCKGTSCFVHFELLS